MLISSLTNPKIKTIVSLRNHKKRVALKLSIVEGIREVSRALDAQVKFKEVFVCKKYLEPELLRKVLSLKIPVIETSEKVFDKISFGERSEGILATIETPQTQIGRLKSKKDSLFVIVEKVEKPGNLGAILRTCDGAGVDGLIVSQQKTDIFNPNVIRASLGAVFTVPIAVSNNEEALLFCKSHNIKVVASLPEAKKNYSHCNMKGSLAIVMGCEQEGLSDFWIKKADEKVSLPMKGKVDSLNVSTSASILIYEAMRQKNL